jgi:twitching motility protein PilI
VPYTRDWFLGVANLRGRLHGVIDLAGFLGVRQAHFNLEQAWFIAFNVSLNINCALGVDKLLGLRNAQQLKVERHTGKPLPDFVGGHYRDEDNRLWCELNLAALANQSSFLKIAG